MSLYDHNPPSKRKDSTWKEDAILYYRLWKEAEIHEKKWQTFIELLRDEICR